MLPDRNGQGGGARREAEGESLWQLTRGLYVLGAPNTKASPVYKE